MLFLHQYFEIAAEKCLIIAQNISSAWLSGSFDNKQRLQSLIFPQGILYNKINATVRTLRVNSLFAEIEPLKRVLDKKRKRQFKNELP
jgi:site-specific DNA recombinase